MTRTLRQGHRGPDVQRWQQFLEDQGVSPGAIDGVFGPKTAEATRAFQSAHGLKADGVAGPQTFGKAASLGLRSLRRLANTRRAPRKSREATLDAIMVCHEMTDRICSAAALARAYRHDAFHVRDRSELCMRPDHPGDGNPGSSRRSGTDLVHVREELSPPAARSGGGDAHRRRPDRSDGWGNTGKGEATEGSLSPLVGLGL